MRAELPSGRHPATVQQTLQPCRSPGALPLLSLLCCACCLGPAIAGQLDDEAPAELLSTRLDNGLQVTILPDPESRFVATNLWYHVGSANEQTSSRGFAHLFEHLMFGDTKTYGKREYAALHHRFGGYENAYTTFDETVYISEITPGQHRRVLEMEADRMVNLVLSQENLDNEKRIVSEEIRASLENDPFARIMRATLEAVLGDHPYGHPPAGTREDVAAATLERVVAGTAVQ